MSGSIRKTAITVVTQRIAELEILRANRLAPDALACAGLATEWEIDRRIDVCQSLLERLQQAPEMENDTTLDSQEGEQ
jgi:hypothetical protein